jgi:hypothetical protein
MARSVEAAVVLPYIVGKFLAKDVIALAVLTGGDHP